MVIQLGSYHAPKVGYDQIQPGDLVCTYEALSTNPKIEKLVSFQKWSSCRSRGELNKMFHWAIVVGTYPRKGVYRIAHVEGSLGKVVLQDDNFKAHRPGQVFVVFRAQDSSLRQQITCVATNTAREGNQQKCSRLPFSFSEKVFQSWRIAQCFLLENGGGGLFPTKQKLAQMAVDYVDSQGFYSYDKSELLSLGCPEYVSYVVCVAKISLLFQEILENRAVSRKERIQRVYRQMRELPDDSFPFHCSTSALSSAYFVDALFKSSPHFECVGCVGYTAPSVVCPEPLHSKEGIFINPGSSLVEQLFPKEDRYQTLSPLFVRDVLRLLRVVSEDGCVLAKSLNPFKVKIIAACFYSKAYNLPLQEAPKEELEAFNSRFQTLSVETRVDSTHIDSVDHLSQSEQYEILMLEKQFLRQSEMDRVTTNYHLSMNTLSLRSLDQTLTEKVCRFFWCDQWADKIRSSKNCEIKQLEAAIHYVHRAAKPNAVVTLNHSVWEANRPWIQFSTDLGTTWDLQPLVLEAGSWKAYICLPEQGNVRYRFFLGPENPETPNPLEQVEAWEKQTYNFVCVSSLAFNSPGINDKEYHLLTTCDSPEWEYIKLS